MLTVKMTSLNWCKSHLTVARSPGDLLGHRTSPPKVSPCYLKICQGEALVSSREQPWRAGLHRYGQKTQTLRRQATIP